MKNHHSLCGITRVGVISVFTAVCVDGAREYHMPKVDTSSRVALHDSQFKIILIFLILGLGVASGSSSP